MQTCETCRHWDKWSDPQDYLPFTLEEMAQQDRQRVGLCGRVGAAPMWTLFSDASLVTRDDFGCIAHEPRE